MNNYLKAAIERYKKLLPKNKQEGYLINPMSEVDCEIIVELQELLKKSGNNEAHSIMKEYKGQVKDSEIRDQLIQCNINTRDNDLFEAYDNIEEDFEDGEDNIKTLKKKVKELLEVIKNNKRKFLIIKSYRFVTNLIFSYKKDDLSSIDKELYRLIINPVREDLTKIPIYANTEFYFDNEEECDEIIENIDIALQKANVEFVNKGEENGD